MDHELRISPGFTSEKLAAGDVSDHVDVYIDRLEGWLFRPAEALVRGGLDCWVPALALLLGYFEGHAVYRDGLDTNGRGRVAFKSVLDEVCPLTEPMPGYEHVVVNDDTADDIGDILYRDGRCGLYHDGFLRRRMLVADIASKLAASTHQEFGRVSAVVVNVERLLTDQRVHANAYAARLRDDANAEARNSFMRGWYLRRPDEELPLPERWPFNVA